MLWAEDNKILHYAYEGERLRIEAWGPDALRVRCTRNHSLPTQNWALSEAVPDLECSISVPDKQKTLPAADSDFTVPVKNLPSATYTTGKITASLDAYGKLSIKNNVTGQQILEEYSRTKRNIGDPKMSAIGVQARGFVSHGYGGNDYHLTYRLESQSVSEKIYGMGQYQQPFLDLKGLDVELAQRNSQATVPFMVSSLNYGFLWNNPAVGRAVLGKNIMSFEARATTVLDFWIVTGDNPKEILEKYANVTGHVPMMPEYGLGFWQCKLRYQTQDELLTVARGYKERNLPINVIVVDFFHWRYQGDWDWDRRFWPDPAAMVRELDSMGIKLLVSIWPTVDKRCANYDEMLEKGLFFKINRGLHTSRDFIADCMHADFTNPETRKHVWQVAKKNYFDIGVRCYWLDEAEPEFNGYDWENYRYHQGSAMSVSNIYPLTFAQAFCEGQQAAGQQFGGEDGIVNLIRCAWAGSQKYGALVWSGDIASSWSSFRNQLAAGLNMGMAGIPWWTTDIGGFYGGFTKDPEFQELLVRWFQWGTFCPVMRLHGTREPALEKLEGAECPSGNDNEVWSFGEENYVILAKHIRFREYLRPYTRRLMQEANEKGCPVIRTMFLEFPQDEQCWGAVSEDQYMFGDKYLCAPVLEAGAKQRKVYLPKGTKWAVLQMENEGNSSGLGATFEGGQTVEVKTPIEAMPVFVRISE